MLEARNIRKVYHNGKKTLEVLKGIDLRIEKGLMVAIVGPSGAGKSTLLHILGGLDVPTAGKVFFEGSDLYSLGDQDICKIRNEKIGFVFQFYHLLTDFSVLENVLLPLAIGCRISVTDSQVRQEALELLDEVGLKERASHLPGELSGGEMQRAAIVRALMNKPSLLFCDEPTGNLDSKAGGEIISLIKKINCARQTAIVLVTHNLELAQIANRIYYLRDGLLVG
jgi:ABC-type lipoprotein export system ATPase subunit